MRYLRTKPEVTEDSGTSQIIIKKDKDNTKLPNNWTLEFFVSKETDYKNTIDLSFFKFIVKNSSFQSKELIDIYIVKNTNPNVIKINLNNQEYEIPQAYFNKKWNHIAIVYSQTTSLLIFINAKLIEGITASTITSYDQFDKFVFTTYKTNNIIYITDIKLYEGIKYNTEEFAITYPLNSNGVTKVLDLILPPENSKEDTIMPIIKNALYIPFIDQENDKYTYDIKLEFKDKMDILKNSANIYTTDSNFTGQEKNIGFSTDIKNSNGSYTLNTPNGFNIVNLDDSDDNYYEMYDLKYKIPSVLKCTNTTEEMIWIDIPLTTDTRQHGNSSLCGENLQCFYHDIIVIDLLARFNFSDSLILFSIYYNNDVDTANQPLYKVNMPNNIYTKNKQGKELVENGNFKPMNMHINFKRSNSESDPYLFDINYNNITINNILTTDNKFHHYMLCFDPWSIVGKIDGVNTRYTINSKAFQNPFNSNENIEFSNLIFNSYREKGLQNYLHNEFGDFIKQYEKYYLRLFLYCRNNTEIAFFRVRNIYHPQESMDVQTLIAYDHSTNFDPTTRLFAYPFDEINNIPARFSIGDRIEHDLDVSIYNVDSKYLTPTLTYDKYTYAFVKKLHNIGINNVDLAYPNYAPIIFEKANVPATNFIYNYVSDSFDMLGNLGTGNYQVQVSLNFNAREIMKENSYNSKKGQYIYFKTNNIQKNPSRFSFVKEIDSTSDIIVYPERESAIQDIETYNYIKSLIKYKVSSTETFKLNNDISYRHIFPVLSTTSFTKERNILSFRNIGYYKSPIINHEFRYFIYPYIKDSTDTNYYSFLALSSFNGYGYVEFKMRPSDGVLKIIYNDKYSYSKNINKMLDIEQDANHIHIINTADNKLKLNSWNEIIILSQYQTAGPLSGHPLDHPLEGSNVCADLLKINSIFNTYNSRLGSIKCFINRTLIDISTEFNLNPFHRLFLFMKSLNSSFIPFIKLMTVKSNVDTGCFSHWDCSEGVVTYPNEQDSTKTNKMFWNDFCQNILKKETFPTIFFADQFNIFDKMQFFGSYLHRNYYSLCGYKRIEAIDYFDFDFRNSLDYDVPEPYYTPYHPGGIGYAPLTSYFPYV